MNLLISSSMKLFSLEKFYLILLKDSFRFGIIYVELFKTIDKEVKLIARFKRVCDGAMQITSGLVNGPLRAS